MEAIMTALEKCREKVNILDLGTDEYVQVNHSIRIITDELGVSELSYAGGSTVRYILKNVWLLEARREGDTPWC